jgi:hypothetical protein
LHFVEDQQRAVRIACVAQRAQEGRIGGITPPSPCTGSTITAQVCGPIAPLAASMSLNGRCLMPAERTEAFRVFRLAADADREGAAVERLVNETISAFCSPWRSKATRRASLSAASLASAPEFAKNAVGEGQRFELFARRRTGSFV